MVLTEADQVWNRAALQEDRSSFRAGDRALSDMLRAHGLAMNGGVYHAVEVLSPDEFEAALAGYRYFDIEALASLLERARSQDDDQVTDSDEAIADADYSRVIPDDDSLAACFEVIFASRRSEFAPVGGEGVV